MICGRQGNRKSGTALTSFTDFNDLYTPRAPDWLHSLLFYTSYKINVRWERPKNDPVNNLFIIVTRQYLQAGLGFFV